MAELKTKRTDASVEDFVASVQPDRRRDEAERLLALFGPATGEAPAMWGENTVGYGSYDYRYASGREGTWFRVGFAPRKANLTIYMMDGFDEHTELLDRLGRHRHTKSCLHITRLDNVDTDVLAELVQASYRAHD